jgi:hypothetical protein
MHDKVIRTTNTAIDIEPFEVIVRIKSRVVKGLPMSKSFFHPFPTMGESQLHIPAVLPVSRMLMQNQASPNNWSILVKRWSKR